MRTLGFLLLVACGGDTDPPTPDTPPEPVAVTIPFAAKVGGQPFACGQAYPNVGSAGSSYVGIDFRFYIHDVRLDDVPVTLDTDAFQADGVALLDFENAGACQMGSSATHTAITGNVPPGDYSTIAFKLGLPFEKNHLDAATAQPPLNVGAMYWAWSSGYKFLKIDGTVGGAGFNLHLGSTGCTTPSGQSPPTAPCSNPNVVDVELTGFSPSSTIAVDVASVLSAVDVSSNTPDTAPGCMSTPDDPECATVFPKLGLPYGSNPAGSQVLFVIE